MNNLSKCMLQNLTYAASSIPQGMSLSGVSESLGNLSCLQVRRRWKIDSSPFEHRYLNAGGLSPMLSGALCVRVCVREGGAAERVRDGKKERPDGDDGSESPGRMACLPSSTIAHGRRVRSAVASASASTTTSAASSIPTAAATAAVTSHLMEPRVNLLLGFRKYCDKIASLISNISRNTPAVLRGRRSSFSTIPVSSLRRKSQRNCAMMIMGHIRTVGGK